MSEVPKALADLLRRYLSPINAQSILDRTLREAQTAPGKPPDMAQIIPRLERSVKLFISPQDLERFSTELRALQGRSSPGRLRVPIQQERHIADALLATRGLCQQASVRPLTLQRAATVVSELARNIVSYTPGGVIELEVRGKRLYIRSSDQGGGIPNLAEIMAGRYRSKTGLGRGLLGTKQLADHFNVTTGVTGTTIDVEISL